MGIQRAAVLYPVNSTTVDTGAGIDVRLLDSAQAGADDDTQTVTATHTQDNQNRTFDPATAGVTTNQGPGTLHNIGWALRLSQDMTPTDDTNCNAFLPAGTLTVNAVMAINQAGGTYTGGTYGPLVNFCLFRYDPSANTGTFIANGIAGAVTWDYTPVTGDLGTFKTETATITIPAGGQEFSQGEILLLQIGINVGTIPNPTIGTATWTYTLRVDHVNTNITWASGQNMAQACALSSSNVGKGTPTRGIMELTESKTAIGKGDTSTSSKATVASKSYSLVGRGVPDFSRAVTAARSYSLTGIGTTDFSRTVVANKSFGLTGIGTVSPAARDLTISRSPVGVGTITFSKLTTASKSFDLVGKGIITEAHPLQAYRTFDLVGIGTIIGRIDIPIDEVPTGSGSTTISPIFIFDD